MKGRHAFAFQTGEWRVRHRKLRERLVGSTDWTEFNGTCSAWELMNGLGNVDEHLIPDLSGTYRAATFRQANPSTGEWSIWWFDPRQPAPEPPVRGGFKNGVGTFFGCDLLRDRPLTLSGAHETFHGTGGGVDARGALRVRAADGSVRAVDSADVTVRRG